MAKKEDINNQKSLNEAKKVEISLEEELLRVLRKRRGIDESILDDQQDINDVLQDQTKQLEYQVSSRKLLRNLGNDLTRIAEKNYTIQQDELGLSTTSEKLAKNRIEIEKKIQLLEQQRLKFSRQANESKGQEARKNQDIAESISEQIKQARGLRDQVGDIEAASEKVRKNFGTKTFAGLEDLAKSIPGLRKFAEPFKEASEAARSQAQSNAENYNLNLKSLQSGKGLTKERIKQMGLDKKLVGKDGKPLTGKAASAAAKKMAPGGDLGKLLGKGMSKGLTTAFKKGLKTLMKSLSKMLKKSLGWIGLVVELVQSFWKIDKLSKETALSLGISTDSSRAMVKNATEFAVQQEASFKELGQQYATMEQIMKAQVSLNKLLDTSVEFPAQMAADFALIQEKTGLSDQAMARFQKTSIATGRTLYEEMSIASDQVMILNQQNGLALNQKQIQEEIGKVGGYQLLRAGRNTKEITNQVYQTKLLGMSMQQLNQTGEKLLDFESSIAAELEAELLTGRELNLEKARAAALAGDQATLAAELRKEVGSAAEFQEMNVLQANAMAKAFGMSRDEMADMLMKQEEMKMLRDAGFESASEAQEKFNALVADGLSTEEAAAKMREDGISGALVEQMKSASQQDKINKMMERMADLFALIVEPLFPIIKSLMQIVHPILKALAPVFQTLADVLTPAANMFEHLPLVMGPAIEGVINGLKIQFGAMLDYIGAVWEVTKGVSKLIYGIATFDWEMIKDGFSNVFTGFLNMMITPYQMIADLFRNLINTSITAINNVKETFGGKKWELLPEVNLKSMLGLAEGGIVTKPTVAMIGEGGEPEAVVPLSKASEMGFSGGASSSNLGVLVEQMNKMNATLNAILNKEGTVVLDSTKVGTALTVGSYKLQ